MAGLEKCSGLKPGLKLHTHEEKEKCVAEEWAGVRSGFGHVVIEKSILIPALFRGTLKRKDQDNGKDISQF